MFSSKLYKNHIYQHEFIPLSYFMLSHYCNLHSSSSGAAAASFSSSSYTLTDAAAIATFQFRNELLRSFFPLSLSLSLFSVRVIRHANMQQQQQKPLYDVFFRQLSEWVEAKNVLITVTWSEWEREHSEFSWQRKVLKLHTRCCCCRHCW